VKRALNDGQPRKNVDKAAFKMYELINYSTSMEALQSVVIIRKCWYKSSAHSVRGNEQEADKGTHHCT